MVKEIEKKNAVLDKTIVMHTKPFEPMATQIGAQKVTIQTQGKQQDSMVILLKKLTETVESLAVGNHTSTGELAHSTTR